jgi:hypothetical protein
MEGGLIGRLERLPADEAFRLAYGAYLHLAGLGDEVKSFTRQLLRRVRAGEAEAVLYCVRKMLEEQDEVRQVIAGTHRHEGQSARETAVNEVQQMLYWPTLIAAGRGVAFEAVRWMEFLGAGLAGREPSKEDYEEGGRDEAAVLRRALTAAGRAVAEFNQRDPAGPAIEAREVALADLRQMAGKEYLASYLRDKV